jgi:ATP-dependent DNA helicase DinG
VDVPGSACQLVVIDRIPFPRPDDPLSSARSQAIARMGGNGFMAVSATHAALRLAQGAGRLVRRGDDRGVVAFLDPRMMTARYAGFLQRSLPPFWPTTDKAMVLAALKRLDETAGEPLPVHEPALRGMGNATAAADAAAAEAAGGADGADGRPVASAPPTAASPRTAVTQGHAWTRDEDAELREGVDLGLTLEELAAHLEVPADLVQARLTMLRLEMSAGARMSFD